VLLFALTVARLSYTEHLPPGDPLNGGVGFFGTRCTRAASYRRRRPDASRVDPSVVALLFSSLLNLIYTPCM
jgi:hypothetical protein